MNKPLNTLLVDDNAEVRQALREFLQELGHQVTEAANGEQAWELWQAPQPPGAAFEALVTDFSMPGICGVVLSERVRRHDSKAAIVLISSQRNNPDLQQRVARGDVVFIHKPFTLQELAEGLRTAQVNTTVTAPASEASAKAATPALSTATPPPKPRATGPAPSTPRARRVQGKSRTSPLWRLPAAAAIILGVASSAWFFYPTSPDLPAPPVQTVRRSSEIVGLSPTGPVHSVPHTLRWEDFPGAAAYRCTIFGVDETILWQDRSTQPAAELPAEIRAQLSPGVSYYWRTEALSATGGRIAASKLARINLALDSAENGEEIR